MTEQLLQFARTGNLEGVRKLIEAEVDVNYQNKAGNTALIWAIGWGKDEVAKLLIKKGANN